MAPQLGHIANVNVSSRSVKNCKHCRAAVEDDKNDNITYDAPPQRIGERSKHSRISVLFGEVHEERGEDEAEKTDVQRCEELLATNAQQRNCTPPSLSIEATVTRRVVVYLVTHCNINSKRECCTGDTTV